jgi:hydroxymethylbilane synthase
MLSLLAFLHDKATATATTAERAFLSRVEGGCQVPVGVYAQTKKDRISIEAVIASLDGKQLLRDKAVGPITEAADLGRQIANKLLDAGGLAIMQQIGLLMEQ